MSFEMFDFSPEKLVVPIFLLVQYVTPQLLHQIGTVIR